MIFQVLVNLENVRELIHSFADSKGINDQSLLEYNLVNEVKVRSIISL